MKPLDRVIKPTALLVVVLVICGIVQPRVFAIGQEAGSLLIFPVFDASQANMTIITITNTNSITTLDPNTGLQMGTIDIMFKYIDGEDCSPENRVERLTPNDTLSIIPSEHNPETGELGFLYIYAIDVKSGLPVAFDYLIGTETIFDSTDQVSFNLTPLAFKAGSLGPDDHKLALDGIEYEMMPDEILIPRFFGQKDGLNFMSPFQTDVIFFNLTGGAMYNAIADVLIYNDNEQVFSSTVEFDCWDVFKLVDVSAATRLSFLESSNHDPSEVQMGPNMMETGWLRIDGNIAYNAILVFDDPAIYAVQIEKIVSGGYAAATLPFEAGEQDNGLLWATSPNGKH